MSLDVLGRGLGGEGGIRTPDSLTTMPDFESGAFNRALPPLRRFGRILRWRFPSLPGKACMRQFLHVAPLRGVFVGDVQGDSFSEGSHFATTVRDTATAEPPHCEAGSARALRSVTLPLAAFDLQKRCQVRDNRSLRPFALCGGGCLRIASLTESVAGASGHLTEDCPSRN